MARPRSQESHQKVLRAVIDLIAENGIEGTSVDAIVRKSGVSKATVYKHWRTKNDICLEAIGRLRGELPRFDSGDARADIASYLRDLAHPPKAGRTKGKMGKIWPRIVGYAEGNAAFRKAWQAHMAEPRRVRLQQLLRQAIASGELRNDIDLNLAMDLLIGPVMHRRFSVGRVPADVSERVVDAFWNAHAARRAD